MNTGYGITAIRKIQVINGQKRTGFLSANTAGRQRLKFLIHGQPYYENITIYRYLLFIVCGIPILHFNLRQVFHYQPFPAELDIQERVRHQIYILILLKQATNKRQLSLIICFLIAIISQTKKQRILMQIRCFLVYPTGLEPATFRIGSTLRIVNIFNYAVYLSYLA